MVEEDVGVIGVAKEADADTAPSKPGEHLLELRLVDEIRPTSGVDEGRRVPRETICSSSRRTSAFGGQACAKTSFASAPGASVTAAGTARALGRVSLSRIR